MRALRTVGLVAAFIFCRMQAAADQTSVGITLNATTGSHVESTRASTIPFLPLPMLEIDHTHGQFRIHLEGVPQLGPVPLAQSNPYTESLAPSVSYLNGELLYRSKLEPIEIGVGETVLNQQTLDRIPYLPNVTAVNYSRIVGMRFVARARLFEDAQHRVDLSLAGDPAMHGLEDGKYAEDASLFDGSLRWTLERNRYDIVYGLRYLNYTAAYSTDHSLGDRNHLFMPFIGIDWHGNERKSSQNDADPPPPAPPVSREATSIGVSLYGSNGTRAYTDAYSQTPLNFVLIPDLQVSHDFGRYEVRTEGILPNENADPFGSSQDRWSYLSYGALAHIGKNGLAVGLGETVVNLSSLVLPPNSQSTSRSDALDFLGRFTFARTVQSESYAFVRLEPYVHVRSYNSFFNGSEELSSTSTMHGARVDATLGRSVYLGRYAFNYGLRYLNQTTNYRSMGEEGVYLTRTTSLMPFVGINVRF